jgi:hypothetical protein
MPDPADPTTPTAAQKKALKRAEQDQKIANAIAEAATLIDVAGSDAEILALLTVRGYDAAALTDALATKHYPAQTAFEARQTAMGAVDSANAALTAVEGQERKDFADYREIARKAYPSAADQIALGLRGTTPADLQKFLTLATASYGAGKKAPYTAKLTVRGYSPAAIDGELAGLKGVASLLKARDIAVGAALKATSTRDAAAKALADWVGEFKKVARRTLRGHPDLLAKLGL